MKPDTSYADKRIAEVLAKPVPKHLKGVFEKYPMTPPRSDVAISLAPSAEVNPIHQLKDQEQIVFGGAGGRSGFTLGRGLLASSNARTDMFNQGIVGIASSISINPDFLEAIEHERKFGKVERHPRKALKSYNRVSKAMVRGFLGEVKHG